MGWCAIVYDRVRASAAAKGVDAARISSSSGPRASSSCRRPTRDYVLFEDFRARSGAASAEDAVGQDRDLLRRDRRLRL